MKNLISLGVFLLILLSVQVNAQEQSVLKIRPTGRILMDGGLFHSDNKNFVDGVAIPDARIGVKATYGKYKAKVDIGYAYGKVSLKDIFVERQFSSHALLRVGNFVHQFGLQSSTSSSMKVTMEEPASNEAFFNSRLMGAMFVYDKNDFFGTASVHVESEALKKKSNELGKMGYGAMSRLVYRPLHRQPFRAWALMESQQPSLAAFIPSEQFFPLILSRTLQVVEVMWIRPCIAHRSLI